MQRLQERLQSESAAAQQLSSKLGDCSGELDTMQSAYRSLLAENKRLKAEKEELENGLISERSNMQKQIEHFQNDLINERQVF